MDTEIVFVSCDGTINIQNNIIKNKCKELLKNNQLGIKYDKLFNDYNIIMNIFRTSNKQYLLFPWKINNIDKFNIAILYAGLKQILVNGSGQILHNLYIPFINNEVEPYLIAFSEEYYKRYNYNVNF